MAGYVNGLRKRGKIWYYKFKFRGRTYHGSTGFESREDAVEYLARLRIDLRKGRANMAEVPSLKAIWERYKTDNTRPCESSLATTGNSVERWILPLIGTKRVSEIGLEEIGIVRRHYLDTPSPWGKLHTEGGLSKVLTDLKTLLNWSKNYADCEGVKLPKIRLPKLQEKVITTVPLEMVERFIEAADPVREDPQVALAVRIMLMMGLRIGEITSMEWGWFSSDFRSYTPGKTKGREAEELPVVRQLVPYILAWREEATRYWAHRGFPLPPLVFFTVRESRRKSKGTPAGQYWSARSDSFARKQIQAAARALGLPGMWGAHRLRHSFATILLGMGVSNVVIQKLLRHKDPKTTERYLHVTHPMRSNAMGHLEEALDAAAASYWDSVSQQALPLREPTGQAEVNEPTSEDPVAEDSIGWFPS